MFQIIVVILFMVSLTSSLFYHIGLSGIGSKAVPLWVFIICISAIILFAARILEIHKEVLNIMETNSVVLWENSNDGINARYKNKRLIKGLIYKHIDDWITNVKNTPEPYQLNRKELINTLDLAITKIFEDVNALKDPKFIETIKHYTDGLNYLHSILEEVIYEEFERNGHVGVKEFNYIDVKIHRRINSAILYIP